MKVIDQIGRAIELNQAPKRIVSLVPSITELLYDLGLESEIVGITRYCILPKEKVKSAHKIGGTKDFDVDLILNLKPDIVFANKEENPKEKVEAIQAHGPVYVSDVQNLEQAIMMIEDIGQLIGRSEQAVMLSKQIQADFAVTPEKIYSAIYLIWNNPVMTVGGDTYISDMMRHAGFENLYADSTRYPIINENDLVEKSPQFLLLSSEPFRFTNSHCAYFRQLLPNTTILLVDGKIFSWYGSHLRRCRSYFDGLIAKNLD